MRKLEIKKSSAATFNFFETTDPEFPNEANTGLIPPQLAEATFELLHAHSLNDDLAWVGDMLFEIEAGIRKPGIRQVGTVANNEFDHATLRLANSIVSYLEETHMIEKPGLQPALFELVVGATVRACQQLKMHVDTGQFVDVLLEDEHTRTKDGDIVYLPIEVAVLQGWVDTLQDGNPVKE